MRNKSITQIKIVKNSKMFEVIKLKEETQEEIDTKIMLSEKLKMKKEKF